jgi:putative DNA methylase
VALTTFSDLVAEAMEKCREDYLGARASRPRTIWHPRGRLPHFEAGEVPQHITFRLHDSLPRELLARWQDELARLPEDEQALERRKRIEAALDAGHGACWLRDPHIAELVEQSLLHFDGERYALHAWCVMPNHVHVLVTPLHGNSLSSILHGWKSFTAKEANRRLGREGPFWMEEYFDRAIRDENHFRRVVEYIGNNPVKAGLCPEPSAWRWSSAWEGGRPARHDSRAGRPRSQDAIPLRDGGTGATAYAEAVRVYLGLAVDRMANTLCTIARWTPERQQTVTAFARQAIPMTWDFPDVNPFASAAGDYAVSVDGVVKGISSTTEPPGFAMQADASTQDTSRDKLVSTDPPYYDNIGYADLSDFFYVWLRRTLKPVFPDLFATLAVPKAEELVATPYRHGSKEKAEQFFLDGMTQAMRRLAAQAHPAFPVTIYYAFKQAETLGARASRPRFVAGGTPALPGVASTGWETFLDAVIRAGFAITGTWPMRTEALAG